MFDSMWVAMWLRVEYGSVRNKSAHYYIANYLYESNIWVDDKWVDFGGDFQPECMPRTGIAMFYERWQAQRYGDALRERASWDLIDPIYISYEQQFGRLYVEQYGEWAADSEHRQMTHYLIDKYGPPFKDVHLR